MKGIIIYYSMTGNTRKIAHAIRRGMAEVADECDIVAIKGANGVPGMRMGHLLEYDLIGIGSPVWRGRITPNILDLINTLPSRDLRALYTRYDTMPPDWLPLHGYEKRLSVESRQHCFFFLTHGMLPGAAVEGAWKALDERGLYVIGWDDWYGNSAMTYAQRPWATEGHPDYIDLNEAREFGRKMVECSRKISEGETNLVPTLPIGQEYRRLYADGEPLDGKDTGGPRPTKAIRIKHDYGVRIDREKCITGCSLCEEHCPVGAIDLHADNPILPNCIWCTTCEMVCPMGAVDINMEALKKDRGVTKEEMHEKGSIIAKGFEESQKNLLPEKRLRLRVDLNHLWKHGYISDNTDHPRVVIPTEGWQLRKKE